MSLPARVEEVLQWFKQARQSNRLSHAYLVVGSPHGDARTFIRHVLPLLLCENITTSGQACGSCKVCRGLHENRHQDVVWVEPQGKACKIPVEVMREMQHHFGQTALSGGIKIAVIWNAERLGEEAANAFLKTLEEPPPGSIFFLVTPSPASVMETVRSRCQQLSLSEAEDVHPPPAWLPHLSAIMDSLEPSGSADAAAWAGFAAANRFTALCSFIRKDVRAQEQSENVEDEDQDAVVARVTARFKEQRALALQALQLWCRDVMLAICGADPALFLYRDRLDAAQRMAGKLGITDIIKKIQVLETLNRCLESNIPEGVAVHSAFADFTAH